MSDTHYSGRCLCGAVTVTVLKEKAIPAACHCTHCQRQTSSAFSPVLLVPVGDIEIKGELRAYDDVNDAGDRVTRCCCPTCGSPVVTRSVNDEAKGFHVVKAGILDGGEPQPRVEVFTRSRCKWLPPLPVERSFEGPAS